MVTVIFKVHAAQIGSEQRHALRSFDSSEPYKRQSTRIQRAILCSCANFNDALTLEAEEHDELPFAFQFNVSVCVRRAASPAALLLEPAGTAIPVIPVVIAADAMFPSNFADAIADPLGLFGSCSKLADRCFEGCSGSSCLKRCSFDARSCLRLRAGRVFLQWPVRRATSLRFHGLACY